MLAARDKDSGAGVSETQIREKIITLMLASHEASATGLMWTVYLLSQHSMVKERLVAELTSVLGGGPASNSDLPQLPYLKQVVHESMRLYLPVWGIARRCTKETEIGGFRIPRDSYVAVTMCALHRHPDY